jgi:hypothetical protein
MGVVVEFQEIVRERRRRQERATVARCVEILRESLAHARSQLPTAPPRERDIQLRRVEQLSDLLDYVERRG